MGYAAEVSRSGLALLLETDASLTSIGPWDVPTAFTLDQNYPNPFNGMTIIQYTLPADGRARIAVTDLLGREVAVIADGEHVAGMHQRAWDASAQTSGVYLCRMTSGSFSQTRKLLLVR
jgi:hypothetical protein